MELKDRIKHIIRDAIDNEGTLLGIESARNEITALIEADYYEKDFVEWLRKECEPGIYTKKGWVLFNEAIKIIKEFESSDKAYKFWIDNVKEK
jgi:hypothetical protein